MHLCRLGPISTSVDLQMSDSEISDLESEAGSLHLETMAEARNVVSAIGEFSPNKERWANYQRRFNAWMRINKIQDDEKN